MLCCKGVGRDQGLFILPEEPASTEVPLTALMANTTMGGTRIARISLLGSHARVPAVSMSMQIEKGLVPYPEFYGLPWPDYRKPQKANESTLTIGWTANVRVVIFNNVTMSLRQIRSRERRKGLELWTGEAPNMLRRRQYPGTQ